MNDMHEEKARIGWWGGIDNRPRCPADGKVIKAGRVEAEKTAKRIRDESKRRGDNRMQAYRCPLGHWHVGHGKCRW